MCGPHVGVGSCTSSDLPPIPVVISSTFSTAWSLIETFILVFFANCANATCAGTVGSYCKAARCYAVTHGFVLVAFKFRVVCCSLTRSRAL